MTSLNNRNLMQQTTNTQKYNFIHELDSGSEGTAYLVQHKSNSQFYVMKRIVCTNNQNRYMKARREARLLKLLPLHRNVLKYIEADITPWTQDSSSIYVDIITPWYERGNLADYILQHGVSEQSAWGYLKQISQAVYHLHIHNIIHRDIKSRNIFLTKDTKTQALRLVLGDFGVAKKLARQQEFAYTAIGTPFNMSPEIAKALLHPGQHLAYGKSTDVWSLGCVFYEMLTTRHPFSGRNTISLYKEIVTKQTAKVAGIESITQALLDGLLSKDPNSRLQLPAIIMKCDMFTEERAAGITMATDPPVNIRPIIECPRAPFSCRFRWIRMVPGQSKFENHEQNLFALGEAIGFARLSKLMTVLSDERYYSMAVRLCQQNQLPHEWKHACKLQSHAKQIYDDLT